jgi:hypothetical protein
MTNFITFLQDVLSHMDYFNNDISTIYVDNDENNIVSATANHPKKQLFYRVESVLDSPLEAPGCIGSIHYLKSVLSSSLMAEEPNIDIRYMEKNGKLFAMSEIYFNSKHLETIFKCTNPDVMNDRDRIRQFPRPPDAVYFPIDKSMRKQFDEISNVATPKADTRLFNLSYDGNYIRAIFGDGVKGTHQSTLILADKSVIDSHTDNKFSNYIYLDRFRTMMKMAVEKNKPVMAFHPKVLWVDFDSELASHNIVIPVIPKIK